MRPIFLISSILAFTKALQTYDTLSSAEQADAVAPEIGYPGEKLVNRVESRARDTYGK